MAVLRLRMFTRLTYSFRTASRLSARAIPNARQELCRPLDQTRSRKGYIAATIPAILIIGLLAARSVGYGWFRATGTSSMYVGTPTTDVNGVLCYPVRSAYQGYREQVIRVLRPRYDDPAKDAATLYILPVDTGIDTLSSTWGDGFEELRLLDVADRFNLTLVAPSFTYEPWYGDNRIDPGRRMESFVVDDLVPFGDKFMPMGRRHRRYVIGFSKSGNGALFLILRNPRIFDAAAAWDCPAELQSLSRFSALTMNFGSQTNYDSYNIPALVSRNAAAFRHQNRLWISGDQGIFTADMVQLHNQLTALSIPHTWVQGGHREHRWDSGWLEGAVSELVAGAAASDPVAGPAGMLENSSK